jgi:hypothetical protein
LILIFGIALLRLARRDLRQPARIASIDAASAAGAVASRRAAGVRIVG